MKQLFILLACVIMLAMPKSPETGPGNGDYIAVSVSGFNVSNYIYRNGTIYYGYDPTSKKTQNTYKRNVDKISELFKMADQDELEKMKSLEQDAYSMDATNYHFKVIEYHRSDTTIRICWDMENVTDLNSRKLNDLDAKMKEFW